MRSSSKSGAFLVEMIIVIAFFAVASAICVRLFVHAHTISSKSRDLNMATITFQSAAECFKAVSGDPEKMLALLDSASSESGKLVVFYDQDWNPVKDQDWKFRLEIDLGVEDHLSTADIAIYNYETEPLYQGRVYSYT